MRRYLLYHLQIHLLRTYVCRLLASSPLVRHLLNWSVHVTWNPPSLQQSDVQAISAYSYSPATTYNAADNSKRARRPTAYFAGLSHSLLFSVLFASFKARNYISERLVTDSYILFAEFEINSPFTAVAPHIFFSCRSPFCCSLGRSLACLPACHIRVTACRESTLHKVHLSVRFYQAHRYTSKLLVEKAARLRAVPASLSRLQQRQPAPLHRNGPRPFSVATTPASSS